jgi:hypothetical protein
MLTTPGGKTLAIKEQRYRAERGVCSAVLSTIQFPVARAGPNFHAHMRIGKFPVGTFDFSQYWSIRKREGTDMSEQGIIAPTTPIGSCRV